MSLTPEQLSLLLSEHAAGTLQRYGSSDPWTEDDCYPRGCLLQVLHNEPTIVELQMEGYYGAVMRFDIEYRAQWTAEHFLCWLEGTIDESVSAKAPDEKGHDPLPESADPYEHFERDWRWLDTETILRAAG